MCIHGSLCCCDVAIGWRHSPPSGLFVNKKKNVIEEEEKNGLFLSRARGQAGRSREIYIPRGKKCRRRRELFFFCKNKSHGRVILPVVQNPRRETEIPPENPKKNTCFFRFYSNWWADGRYTPVNIIVRVSRKTIDRLGTILVPIRRFRREVRLPPLPPFTSHFLRRTIRTKCVCTCMPSRNRPELFLFLFCPHGDRGFRSLSGRFVYSHIFLVVWRR